MENSQALHILHIEDDPVDAELVRQTLLRSDLDCRVSLAMCRADYTRALQQGGVDLILSDNRGYDFDGLEVLRTVRRHHPGIPFLFLSGSFEGKDLEQLKAEGASDCLLKSDSEILVPAIRRVLDEQVADPREVHVRQLELLLESIQKLGQARDAETVVAQVCRAARELAGSDAAALCVREDELCHILGEDAVVSAWKGKRYPLKGSITEWVIENRKPLVLDDTQDSMAFAVIDRLGYIRSIAALPLGSPEPFGSLSTGWRGRHRPTAEEIRLMGLLADAAAVALENMRGRADLERQLLERRRDLEAVTKELEAFSYSVSHDLRGPLRSVSGFGKLLAKDYEDRLDEAGKNFLAYVTDGTQRIATLVDALLSLSRVSRAPLVKSEVDLTALAKEIAAKHRRDNPSRKCELKIATGLRAQADPALARILLENLLDNACKFSSRRAEAHIEFGSTPEAGHDIFYVKDDGAGFEMAYADKLFTPFQRQHRQDEFEGAGVGLAAAQRIVMRHGGRIWAEAVEGEGATFFFTLEDGESDRP